MFHAGVAQLVEQLIRNQQVAGSSPAISSIFPKGIALGAFLLQLAQKRAACPAKRQAKPFGNRSTDIGKAGARADIQGLEM